ncbi:hypothetical protein CC86DRAFT_385958 [Ophiobolus disseminans]|uniref:RING-type domain-containing protein n=1 Tax=Ophiobolus disseminans TaxID=1469910 RepID=A0A6A6ZMG6_9PLEO|nr:hypothetical protein CC86DRAFT_385958 [Ophiobolus disseminans]
MSSMQSPSNIPEPSHNATLLSARSSPFNAAASLRSQGEFYMTGVIPVTDDFSSPSDVECSICMEQLSSDVVKMAACNYHFHAVCILLWFEKSAPRHGKKKGTCPNCRHALYEPDPLPPQRGMRRSVHESRPIFGEIHAVHNDRPRATLSTSRPLFHAGSTRDSLEITDERRRRRLQTIVGIGTEDATDLLQRSQMRTGEQPASTTASTSIRDGITSLSSTSSRVDYLERQVDRVFQYLEQYTMRMDALVLSPPRQHAPFRTRGEGQNSRQSITPSPMGYIALRREFERSLERSGLSAEQMIEVWRRQGPLANDDPGSSDQERELGSGASRDGVRGPILTTINSQGPVPTSPTRATTAQFLAAPSNCPTRIRGARPHVERVSRFNVDAEERPVSASNIAIASPSSWRDAAGTRVQRLRSARNLSAFRLPVTAEVSTREWRNFVGLSPILREDTEPEVTSGATIPLSLNRRGETHRSSAQSPIRAESVPHGSELQADEPVQLGDRLEGARTD